jgi:Putative zinc-finger
MNTCLDEGMLQAYLDGELAGAQMKACAAHLATCATCAELAHEAEHEYAIFSTAFAPLLSTPAPTERLRARLDDAIAELQAPRFVPESSTSRLRAWWSAFTTSFAFSPRYVGAFATFLLAIALTVVLTMLRSKQPAPVQVAQKESTSSPTASPSPLELGNDNQVQKPSNGTDKTSGPGRSTQMINVRGTKRSAFRPNTNYEMKHDQRAPQAPPSAPLIPEEKSYLTTIATLDAAIKAQGQAALPPTLRAEFERNLAVVDEALIATRVAARRNPKDADAQEFLRAAYQNKVDLLTTVADQTQYIAARD